MDKPTTPGGGNSSGSPWTEDTGSEMSFGATGAFGILKLPEEAEKPAPVPAFKPEPEKTKPSRMTGQFPAYGGKPLEEPVVHKVVLGGAEEGSAELLDRIRMAASGERPAFKEKAPAGQPGDQGSSGFTQLLRSLGGESAAPAPSARQAPAAEPQKPAPISGFTSLLQTLNAPDPKTAAAAPTVKPAQVDVRPPLPEPPKAPPPSPASAAVDPKQGTFTEYLEALAMRGSASSKPAARVAGPGEAPLAAAKPAPPPPAPPPAPPQPASAVGSFTQLFGTFESGGTSAPAQAPGNPPPRSPGFGEVPLAAASPTPPPSAPGSFTQLFGTFGSAEAGAPAASQNSPTAPASAPGSFTELFGTLGSAETSAPAPGSPPGRLSGFGEAPSGVANPPAGESKPGAFTQLFGTFGNAEASTPAAAQIEREPAYPPAGGIGSFTRMLSLEQESAAPAPPLREERMPLPGAVDYGLTPETARAGSAGPDRDPFSEALPELAPAAPSTPSSSGVGITQLIRMLEQPATPSAPPAPVASAAPASGGGPGIWTQTFQSLSESSAAPAPAAPPSWAPAPVPPVVSPAPAPAAAGTPAGPSEFTRILDASRMRELAMKGGQAEGAASAMQPAASAGATTPMPKFAAPPMPAPPAMPAMKGMPAFAPPPPPPAPVFPMNFAPPANPAPPVPQPPAVKAPAPPAAGKLQQMVPLLLVMVIVLLVVLLVTVIFLMKH